jgi:branched-chain amino acid transport system ATP-binding protein
MFELRDVDAGYGGTQVLRGVDLIVPAQSIVALLGPNRAGKTNCH